MMNEPVSEMLSSPAAPAGGARSAPSSASVMEGMGNSAQMAQMLQNMSPEELQQMATMMGLTPRQLELDRSLRNSSCKSTLCKSCKQVVVVAWPVDHRYCA